MCNHGDETHVEQRPSAAGVVVTVLTHGLVVEQRHPVDTTCYCGQSPEFLADKYTEGGTTGGVRQTAGSERIICIFLYIVLFVHSHLDERRHDRAVHLAEEASHLENETAERNSYRHKHTNRDKNKQTGD